MRISSALALLPFTVWAGAALAEPASPEGAAALTTVMQTYLGAAPGVVTVAPEGDVYGVKIDFTPLLAKIPAAEIDASATPYEFKLEDQGDGTWKMTQDQAFDFSFKVPNEVDFSLNVANYKGEGVFDEGLQTFTSGSGTATDVSIKQMITAPEAGGNTDVSYHIDSVDLASTGAEGASDGVDSTSKITAKNISETFNLPPMGEGAPSMAITFKAETYSADTTLTSFRPDAFYKLVAFMVANPDAAAVSAKQDDLKAIIKDGVPFFDNLKSVGTMQNLSVETPMGMFGATAAGVEVEANGVVEDGKLREALSFDGLTIPAGIAPDWSADLIPTKLSLDFALTRFNLAAPMDMILTAMDLTKNPPMDESKSAELLAALLPDGAFDVTIAPGGVTAAAYGLTYEGNMSISPAGGMPVGKAKLTLSGIDKIQAALDKAPDDQKGQILPMLGMAQGMGQPGDNGELVWNLEATAEGAMMVNGMNMGGGQ